MTKATCAICGNPLGKNRKKYCSDECAKIAIHRYYQKRNKELYKSTKPKELPKRRRRKSSNWSRNLAEINERARALGMSYGHYVGKYGL